MLFNAKKSLPFLLKVGLSKSELVWLIISHSLFSFNLGLERSLYETTSSTAVKSLDYSVNPCYSHMLILTLMHMNPSTSKCLYPCAGNKQVVYLKLKSREKKLKKKTKPKKHQKNRKGRILNKHCYGKCYLKKPAHAIVLSFVCDTWLENCTKKLLCFHSFAIA